MMHLFAGSIVKRLLFSPQTWAVAGALALAAALGVQTLRLAWAQQEVAQAQVSYAQLRAAKAALAAENAQFAKDVAAQNAAVQAMVEQAERRAEAERGVARQAERRVREQAQVIESLRERPAPLAAEIGKVQELRAIERMLDEELAAR